MSYNEHIEEDIELLDEPYEIIAEEMEIGMLTEFEYGCSENIAHVLIDEIEVKDKGGYNHLVTGRYLDGQVIQAYFQPHDKVLVIGFAQY